MGPRNAALCGGSACGAAMRTAPLGVGDACGRQHWGLRWSSLWGHETLHWVGETHANCATGTFGGAPYGATQRCTGWGKRMRCRHADCAAPLGPSLELPMGLRNVALR